jgi:hypothetical protein
MFRIYTLSVFLIRANFLFQVAAQNCRKRKQRYLEVLVEQLSRLKEQRHAAERQHILLLREQQRWQLRLRAITHRVAAHTAPPSILQLANQDRASVLKSLKPPNQESSPLSCHQRANREQLLVCASNKPANRDQKLDSGEQALELKSQQAQTSFSVRKGVIIKQEPLENPHEQGPSNPQPIGNSLLPREQLGERNHKVQQLAESSFLQFLQSRAGSSCLRAKNS